MRRGFWFNYETGEFKDAIFNSHLSCVVAEPEAFGVTADFIQAQFDASKDQGGADARHGILLGVLERSNWTRWREMSPPIYSHRWSVEVWSKDGWAPNKEALLRVLEKWTEESSSGMEHISLRYLQSKTGFDG